MTASPALLGTVHRLTKKLFAEPQFLFPLGLMKAQTSTISSLSKITFDSSRRTKIAIQGRQKYNIVVLGAVAVDTYFAHL